MLSARLQAAGARVRAYDPVAEDEARKLIRGVDFRDARARRRPTGADAVVLVTEWPEFAELDLAELAGAMRGDAAGRRAQLPRRRARCATAGLDVRGRRPAGADGARREPARTRLASAGADPRGRRGHAAAPADDDVSRSRSCRSSTGRSSASCSTGCAATASTDVVMSCGHMADGVRDVLGDGSGVRRPAAVRRGAAAARHRRRAEVRRGRCSTTAS